MAWLGVSLRASRLCGFSKMFTSACRTLCCPHNPKSGRFKSVKRGSTIFAAAGLLEIALLFVKTRNSSEIVEHTEIGATDCISDISGSMHCEAIGTVLDFGSEKMIKHNFAASLFNSKEEEDVKILYKISRGFGSELVISIALGLLSEVNLIKQFESVDGQQMEGHRTYLALVSRDPPEVGWSCAQWNQLSHLQFQIGIAAQPDQG
nr:hypothetical protein Iba_chr11bCG9560 [Ipomoea batatas]